jgi:S1-C subfamily serine protease
MLKAAPFVLAIGLGACATYKKPLPAVASAAPAANPVVFKFTDRARQARLVTIVFDLPVGYRYGEAAGGGRCNRKQPLVNTKGSFEFDTKRYADVFNDGMRKHGYPAESGAELFRDSKERVADLQVGARIVAAVLNECFPDYENDLKAIGSAYLKIEWSVYSSIDRKIIFVTTTEGSTYGEVESIVGEPGIIRPALADAVERLALRPDYREVIDAAKAPAEVAKAAKIKIKRAKQFTGSVTSNIESIKKAVATVTANKGLGSGFVISDDGAVLTAEHVISGSKFVKVNTAAGKECYGEVVAASKQRDLAIVRVDCAGLSPLPLGREKILEGGEVFAVGTPLSPKLQFSVTKGVVSGVRTFEELDYIQSDVSVLPGSSGGPLLDAKGNAIGMTTSGLSSSAVPLGVNFFIPLLDMEKYLPVELE